MKRIIYCLACFILPFTACVAVNRLLCCDFILFATNVFLFVSWIFIVLTARDVYGK